MGMLTGTPSEARRGTVHAWLRTEAAVPPAPREAAYNACLPQRLACSCLDVYVRLPALYRYLNPPPGPPCLTLRQAAAARPVRMAAVADARAGLA